MAPWKCPDCGTWWSGLEHRCPPLHQGWETTTRPPVSMTVTCTCVYDDHGRRIVQTAPCPIHDVLVTYTT